MRNRKILVVIIALVLAIPFAFGCAARCKDCGMTVKVTVLDGINFDFNKYAITPSGKTILEKDVALLKKNKSLDVSIEGHCDIAGPDNYNQMLSERRAKVVYDYFLSQGIAADRMRTLGWGRKKPLVPNDTKANRAKNRRVEINIIKARA